MELIKVLLTSSGGVAILTGIGWFIRKFYETKKARKKREKKEGVVEGLRSIAKVYNAMSNLRKCDEIERVLLLEVSNGGNTPRPGSKVYASAVNVKHMDSLMGKEILEKYERVKIDDEYINMCITVQAGNEYRMHVEKHHNCLLKDFYVAEGVKYSEVYHIYTDGEDEKMFILTVSTYRDKETFKRDELRAIIRAEVMFIRMEFERLRGI